MLPDTVYVSRALYEKILKYPEHRMESGEHYLGGLKVIHSKHLCGEQYFFKSEIQNMFEPQKPFKLGE